MAVTARRLYFLPLLLLLPVAVIPAQPPVRSALTGAELPAAVRLEKGFMTRAAARATLELRAGDAGVKLGSDLEVFRLPLGDSAVSRSAIFTALRTQGFTLALADSTQSFGVLSKAGARHLLLHAVDRRSGWLYIGQVTGDAVVAAATAAPPATPTAAPVPGAPAPTAPAAAAPAAAAPTAAAPSAPPPNGPAPRFQLTSTTWADGWSATDQPDHVQLAKGDIRVWLWHRVPLTEAMRPPAREVKGVFWARDVAARYRVTSVDDRTAETRYSALEYREGAVTTLDGRSSGYVGMFVSIESGTAQSIVVLAPTQAAFRQLFPTPESLEPLARMNKFGVAATDLPGTWSSSGGAYVPMYYVSSGLYAGTDGASIADRFTFFADGTYQSVHSGASGTVGRLRPFTQRYQGRWQLNGIWELVLTNRYDKKTETYAVSFSSVTGGRVLHLTNKERGVDSYSLGRAP